jgi:hypothetical protein
MVAFVLQPSCNSGQRQIVGFGAAAGENDLVNIGTDQLAGAASGQVQRRRRFPSELVQAGRIAEFAFEKRQHLLQHGRVQRSR